MCRSKADGGRRCSGHHENDGQESYAGTPWQGYDEYQQRSAELDRRVANGESITEIMQAEQLARTRERIAQIVKEGW
jgi:hypothetical protein